MADSEVPGTQIKSSEKFFHYFQNEVHDLQQIIAKLESRSISGGERQDTVDHCLTGIARLSDEVNDISSIAPARDQRTYADAIRALNVRLQEARAAVAPRPKFAFKSGLAFAAKKNASPVDASSAIGSVKDESQHGSSNAPKPSHASGTVEASGDDLISTNPTSIPGDVPSSSSLHIAEQRGTRIAPEPSSLKLPGSGTILDIERSVVDLSRFKTHASSLAGLVLKRVIKSLVICGRVEGAAHFTGMHNSVIVVLSRQFRMHDSTNCQVYLHTSSRPIIEDCSGISFAPVPPCFRSETDEGTGEMWSNVDDFKWLKNEPSPNWRVLESQDRVLAHIWDDITSTGDESDVSTILRAVHVPT